MIIVHGWNKRGVHLTEEGRFCKKCTGETAHQVSHVHYTFHLGFIFTHVFRTRYEYICSNCGSETQLPCTPELLLKYGAPEISGLRRYGLIGSAALLVASLGIVNGVAHLKAAHEQKALAERSEASKQADQGTSPETDDGFINGPEGVRDGDWHYLYQQFTKIYEKHENQNQLVLQALLGQKHVLEAIPEADRQANLERISEALNADVAAAAAASEPEEESAQASVSEESVEGVSEEEWDVLRKKLLVLYQENDDRDTLVSNHLNEYKKSIQPIPASYRKETIKRINESLDESIESRKPEKTANQSF